LQLRARTELEIACCAFSRRLPARELGADSLRRRLVNLTEALATHGLQAADAVREAILHDRANAPQR